MPALKPESIFLALAVVALLLVVVYVMYKPAETYTGSYSAGWCASGPSKSKFQANMDDDKCAKAAAIDRAEYSMINDNVEADDGNYVGSECHGCPQDDGVKTMGCTYEKEFQGDYMSWVSDSAIDPKVRENHSEFIKDRKLNPEGGAFATGVFEPVMSNWQGIRGPPRPVQVRKEAIQVNDML